MTILSVDRDAIPEELREQKRWLAWRPVGRAGKIAKVPLADDWTDPDNCRTFDEVYAVLPEGQGVGFLLGGEYVGLDFDNCFDLDGSLLGQTQQILKSVPGYSETSVSGKGIHVIAKVEAGADLQPVGAGRKAGFEFYPGGRFFTFTGRPYGESQLRDATRPLAALIQPFYAAHEAADRPHWSDLVEYMSETQVESRVRNYLGKCQPAVAGEGGSGQMMRICSALAWGFALSDDEAWPLLCEYNATCDPPFDERAEQGPDSLLRKWREACRSRNPELLVGRLLDPFAGEAASAAEDGLRFEGVAACDLWDLADQPVEWLVQDVFSADQPSVFGAKSKSLKTTLLTDLAIALATGTPWLDHFEIPRQRRTLFLTGESTQRAASRKMRRAIQARGLGRADIGDSLRIEAANFPTLPQMSDCVQVARAITEHRIEVVIVDPLYMGMGGCNMADLTEVGPALRGFMQACRPARVILSHHVRKTATFDKGKSPDLEDLSMAGIAEFAGNYWLAGRMSDYTGNGKHELAVKYGGRDEQFGLIQVDFDEKAWTAEIKPLGDSNAEEAEGKEQEKIDAKAADLFAALQAAGGVISEAKLSGYHPESGLFRKAITQLEEFMQVEFLPAWDGGKAGTVPAWKLATN